MIHPPSREGNGYTISSHRQWLPGAYETPQAARYAFQFPEIVLSSLAYARNEFGSLITTDDLRALNRKDDHR